MDISSVFQQLGIALGLGLLIGLQRESAASSLAGVRTFPIVTIFGTVSALLAQLFGGWIIGAGFIALAVLILVGKIIELNTGKPDPGLTTEIVILLMFGLGAYLVNGYKEVAIAVAGVTAVLLQFKGQLHGMVAKLGENDLKAIMQFTLISLVILPVLPNRTYGPYSVLNPYQIWLMVTLIVGISLCGYIIYKFFGSRAGVLLGGILGGLISSTATTVSYAKRTVNSPENSRAATIIILISSTVVFARLLLEIATVAPSFLRAAAPPLLILLVLLVILSVSFWFMDHKEKDEMPNQENPSELKSALLFGLIYVGVLFAVAVAKEKFGSSGLYVVAGISGLTDVDAITLSTSQLVSNGRLDPNSGWRLIVIAIMSNIIFKTGTVAFLGHRQLLKKVALFYSITLLVGSLLLVFWPNI
jgi:uncharacterized membrane protein (DUF4010 family)